MTSKLTLYFDSLLLPEKNFALDSRGSETIENYLSTLTQVEIKDFQYIKHELTLSIKINTNQVALNIGIGSSDLNYCKIQNGTDNACYYFIINKKWIAQNTIQLVLAMDTLNTFKYDVDYSVSPKTLIKRQHKDRLKWIMCSKVQIENIPQEDNRTSYSTTMSLLGSNQQYDQVTITSTDASVHILSYDVTISNNQATISFTTDDGYSGEEFIIELDYSYFKLFKMVDLVSEGINPILYKKSESKITADGLDWYLIYMNQNAPSESLENPVNCFICANEQIQIAYTGGSQNIVPKAMQENMIYYVRQATFSPSDAITLTTDNSSTYTTSRTGSSEAIICFKRTNNKIYIALLSADQYGNISIPQPNAWRETSFLASSVNPLIVRISNVFLPDADQVDDDDYTERQSITLSNASILINSIEDIDRTNSKIIKIIKLPYNPIDMTLSGGIYDFDRTIYTYDTTMRMIKLLNLNTKFNKNMVTSINPLSVLVNHPTIVDDMDRNDNFESKLLHSDFYQMKFVYDSFGYGFALERVNMNYFSQHYDEDFTIKYVVTSTINSRFMFMFESFNCSGLEAQDYNNVLPIARNNEITLYNQQYINYLRNGFNYDVKSKTRQEAVSWIGVGLSALGAVASFIGGGSFGAVAGIGLGVSTLSNIMGAINTTIQSEQNMEAKQQQLKSQASSVYGSDDVDLMSEYTENKAKYTIYQISDRMIKAISDLFFYCGYTFNVQGKPDVTSRERFNFIQASLVINAENNIPNDIMNDIIEKFDKGVTFLHYSHSTFDFNQEKENFEISIL